MAKKVPLDRLRQISKGRKSHSLPVRDDQSRTGAGEIARQDRRRMPKD
jgi:hypothetical protein